MKKAFSNVSDDASVPIVAETRKIDGSLSDAGKIERELRSLAERRKSDPDAFADFSGHVFVDIDFTAQSMLEEFPQLLRGADFSNSSFINCRFGHDYVIPPAVPGRVRKIEWSAKRFCDLTGAIFNQAILFGCSFSGANLGLSQFVEAEIYHTSFSLTHSPDQLMGASVSFRKSILENCDFRGSLLDVDMSGAEVLATDFGPIQTEPFEGRTGDHRLERAAKLKLRLPGGEFKRIVENAKHILTSRAKFNDATLEVWDEIFRQLEKLRSGRECEFHIAGMVGAKLSNAKCDDAKFAECEFGWCHFSPKAVFDEALLFNVSFSAEPPDDDEIVKALRAQFLSSIYAEIDPIRLKSVGRGVLERMASQIATEVAWADEVALIVDAAGTEISGGVAPSDISDCSFWGAVIAESQFNNTKGLRARFRNAYLLDSSIADAVWPEADLRNSIFYRVVGNRVKLEGAKCDRAAFDGEFVEDDDMQLIEDMAQRFNEAFERDRAASNRNRKKIRKIRKEFRLLRDRLGFVRTDFDGGGDSDSDNDLEVDEPPVLDDEYRKFLSRSDVSTAQKRDMAKLHRMERKNRRRIFGLIGSYFQEVSNDFEEQNTGADGLAEAFQVFPNACSLREASFKQISAQNGAVSFRACRLDGADFREAAIGSGDARTGAQFDMAVLRAARFNGADLQRVNFSGATLTSVEGLPSAINLDGANFLNSHGLQGNEFRGANVTGVTLPLELQSFGGILDAIEKLTRQARILFASLMFVCAYSVLTLATFDHTDTQTLTSSEKSDVINPMAAAQAAEVSTVNEKALEKAGRDVAGESVPGNAASRPAAINSSSGLRLPVLSIEVPRELFFVVTPLLILSFYGMFQLKFARIVLEAQALPHKFPDGRPVDRHLFPWIFASLARIFLKPKRPFLFFQETERAQKQKSDSTRGSGITEKVTIIVEQFLALVFGWAIVPLILTGFIVVLHRAYKEEKYVMDMWDMSFTPSDVQGFITAIIVISIVLPILTTQLSMPVQKFKRPTFEPVEEKQNFLKRWINQARRFFLLVWAFVTSSLQRLFGTAAALGGIAVIAILGGAMIGGPSRMEQLSEGASNRFGAAGGSIASSIDSLTKSLYSVKLDSARLVALHAGRDDNPGLDFDLVRMHSGNLKGIDFASARLYGAEFQDTDFSNADFSESILTAVDFNGSDLTNANFQNARLYRVRLDHVTGLTASQVQGACADAQTRLPREIGFLPKCEADSP